MIPYLLSLTLLIAAVLVIRGIFRKTVSPRAIYALWLAVVLRMFLPFPLFVADVTLPAFLMDTAKAPAEETVFPLDDPEKAQPVTTTPSVVYPSENVAPVTPVIPALTFPQTTIPGEPPMSAESHAGSEAEPLRAAWKTAADTVWLVGVLLSAAWILFAGLSFTHRLKQDRMFHKTIRKTKVYISESAGVPCIAGFPPAIYITPEAANSKSETLILIHEHIHLRHGDPIWAIVRGLALIVFWWNPLVWAAAFVSKQDGELACDDAIAAKLNDETRLRYARILLDTIPRKHRLAERLSPINGLGGAPMKERILMLTAKRKNRTLCLVLALSLALGSAGCSFVSLREKPEESDSAVTDPADTGKPAETESVADPVSLELSEYLTIPPVTLTEAEELPQPEDTAQYCVSPVGGYPVIFFFDDSLTFYEKRFLSLESADASYVTGTLTLPEGFTDASVVHTSRGGGSGEAFVIAEALRNGEKEYLSYFFNYNHEPFVPTGVSILRERETAALRESINMTPICRSIYRCDDVYRTEDTSTHGEAFVYLPIGLTDYRVKDCQVLLCDDGCDPTDVVSRAFWGYGPAWPVDRFAEYGTADGWQYPTRNYFNEVPETIREQMRAQGAPDSVIFPREYLYLVTLDDTHYAYINIVPRNTEGEKPENEEAAVSDFVKQIQVVLSAEEDGTKQTLAAFQSVLENQTAVVWGGDEPDMTLGQFQTGSGLRAVTYALVDLDGDSNPEMILNIARAYDQNNGSVILRHEKGTVYGYYLWHRMFSHQKADGTFHFSSGARDNGTGRITFAGEELIRTPVAWCESVGSTGIAYYIGEKSVTEDEYRAYVEAQNQKSDPVWVDLPLTQVIFVENEASRAYSIPWEGRTVTVSTPKEWYWDGSAFCEAYNGTSAFTEVKRLAFRKAEQTEQEFAAELTVAEEGYTAFDMEHPLTGSCYTGGTYVGYCGSLEQVKGLREKRYLFYIEKEGGTYILDVRQHIDRDGETFEEDVLIPMVKHFEVS